LTIAFFEVGNKLIKAKIIMIVFCLLGIWLIWDFRLIGLFAYTAILFCVSLSGIFETGVMPKSQEKKTVQAMYLTISLIFVLVIAMGFAGLLRPTSVAIAKAANVPSFYDNVVLLLNGNQDELTRLLGELDSRKQRKILAEVRQVGNSKNIYYAVSIISLASSIAFVVFKSICITNSRLPFIDVVKILEMNSRAKWDGIHKLFRTRVGFCVGGLTVLGMFFQYFVTSRVGIENVGGFWADGPTMRSRGNIAVLALFYQITFLFVLWHYARFPFRLKSKK